MRRWRALAVPIGFVVVLVLVVSNWSPLRRLDRAVANGLNDVTAPHPALVGFWRAVSAAGQPLTFQLLAVAVALLLWRRSARPRLAAFTAITVVLAGSVSNLAKLLVGRDRPSVPETIAHAAGSSFPSGHALTSFVGVTVLLLVTVPRVPTRWRAVVVVAGVLIVLLIGFSRLALGVHYLSDVIAGWLLGGTWVLAGRLLVLTGPGPRSRRRGGPGRLRGTPAG